MAWSVSGRAVANFDNIGTWDGGQALISQGTTGSMTEVDARTWIQLPPYLAGSTLPLHSVVEGPIPGRSGTLATQGPEFLP